MSVNFDKTEYEKLLADLNGEMLDGKDGLGESVLADVKEKLRELDDVVAECERLKLALGRLLDYDSLRKDGFSPEQIEEFEKEDSEYITRVDGFLKNNIEKRDYMFGYPANMESFTYTVQYLRFVESKLYLMNNCGDPYQKGNYGMDSKDIEREIISIIAENLGIEEGSYWGYITSGGTESNFWGIREGFARFPEGKLYFSHEAHYSVEKFVSSGKDSPVYPYEIVPSNADGSIDVEKLLNAIRRDKMEKGVKGAILVLTWGTTCKGAIDDVKKITSALKDEGIPYYCHLDAALYGGIASNQVFAPSVCDLKSLNVDSVSVSLHKFIGTARVNGILLALSRSDRQKIEYIGQEDSTILGSRDYFPLSTYQRVKENYLRKRPDYYKVNVEYFESALTKANIAYEKFDSGNIFVIKKPSEKLCKKYQLATFKGDNGEDKAHVIVFPFHKRSVIDEFVGELESEFFAK